ncbi:MAG: glycosyltransferase family 4 protein [Lachnospiraceae bacterium]|nr:glycosyltransferase family 4 protein [Lachnospiraceae bacterium]
MSQIRILFLHAGAEMYGADKVMFDLICGLDKTKYKAYVVLPVNGVLVEELRKKGISVCVIPYPIMRRKYFNPSGIVNYIRDFIKYSKKLIRLAKEYNIDVIHTNTSAVLEGSYIRFKLKIPQLWEIHEIIVKPKIIFYLTSLWISLFSDKTITVSDAAKRHLIQSGFFKHKRIKVIYNGVDSGNFVPDIDNRYLYREFGIPTDSRVIGMIGRVNSWKGQSDFLDAACMIMKKYSDVYTIFVGAAFEGEEWREKELKEKIAASGFEDRIINMGYIRDTAEIHRLLDIFVLPSTNPDPLPTVVLEAMASGRPIVAYRHGGVCEMVKEGENGLLADACDPADLAKKIEVLINDDELRQKMGSISRKRQRESFSLDSNIRKYEKEYSLLVRNE